MAFVSKREYTYPDCTLEAGIFTRNQRVRLALQGYESLKSRLYEGVTWQGERVWTRSGPCNHSKVNVRMEAVAIPVEMEC